MAAITNTVYLRELKCCPLTLSAILVIWEISTITVFVPLGFSIILEVEVEVGFSTAEGGEGASLGLVSVKVVM